jgi:serine/threonine protein kinase
VREAKAQTDDTVDTILQVGQVVAGKYRVEYLAGRGGMAAVWAGTNERTGKRVALKVILQSMSTTADAQHLFHSEALAASRVNHPNVVTIFDVIDHEGMTCIVMEFLDGEPLSTYIARKGALSVAEATALLLPAMRGVAAAHAQDVIHRDLKPQNIFVCIGPDGRVVTSKVLDFGISVMLERAMGASSGPVPGLHMGTPAYMSPEHLSGDARIDERTDVYGFGLLLYEALTGQTPFPGEPGTELFKRVLTQLPTPVTNFRPDLPPGLVRIIDVAIAKEPDHRYSDLNLMVTALEDELLPSPSLPHLITPIMGVPAQAFRDALSGQSVVQAILRKEPSGPYPETKALFGFSLPKQNDGFPGPGAALANGAGAKGETAAPPVGRETVVLHWGLGSAFLRIRSLSALRAWLYFALRPCFHFAVHRRRELVGAGIAAALTLTVWMVFRGPGREQAAVAAPDTKVTQPAPDPARPSPLPTVVPTVTPVAATLEAAPGAAEGGAKSSPQRQPGRSLAKVAAPARASRDRSSAKLGRPRAGSLSEDDF